MLPRRQPSKRMAWLPKSFPEMRNLRTRALGQPPLEKEKVMTNTSRSQRRQTQLQSSTLLLLGSRPRWHPLLYLDLGNQDFPKTRRTRRCRVSPIICGSTERRRSSVPVVDTINMAGYVAGEKYYTGRNSI